MNNQNKRDPYNSEKRWDNWINSKPSIPETSKFNSDLIIDFLRDFSLGKNTSKVSQKGERSPIRLMALKSRMSFFAKQFKNRKFTTLTKDDVHVLFKDMHDGKVLKENGQPYISTGSYTKDWKAFWNWMIKTEKVKNNINEDLSRRDEKAAWVYLDEREFKTLADQCSPDYHPLVWLMLDAGCRVTEAYSIKVSDFGKDFSQLTIRAETSKNRFERTINLKLCSSLIKEYVSFYKIKEDDFLFQKKPATFNKYIKEKCIKTFCQKIDLKDKIKYAGGDLCRLGKDYYINRISHTRAKGKFSEFSLYSIRHIASCYWLKRYQSHSDLMYRMAWTSEKLIRYYSEFLGQSDKIRDEDMITKEDRTKYEKEIDALKVQLENQEKEMNSKIKSMIFEALESRTPLKEFTNKRGAKDKLIEIKEEELKNLKSTLKSKSSF